MRKLLVTVLLVSASPALAGNYGENVGVGSGSGFDATRSRFDRAWEMEPSGPLGYGPRQTYDLQMEAINRSNNPNLGFGKVVSGIYDAVASVGDWMSTGHQISLGQVNYSQPAYGIGTSSFSSSGFRAEPGPGGY